MNIHSNPRVAGTSTAPATAADVALTGDRPTGRLHLGHYAGSIRNRLRLQNVCPQTILVADMQALTDNAGKPGRVRANVRELVLDYLACGIDPASTDICLQSGVPELSELTILYLNLVSVSALERNPTVRSEMESKGMERSLPAGFLVYPVSQAADITAFGATVVPAGGDQLPMIEVSNHVVKAVNTVAGRTVLNPSRAILSSTPRLVGTDGRAKAGKSLGNAIDLADEPDVVRSKVMSMYTDPEHLKVSDPGRVEGNAVFAYLDAFDPDLAEVERLKERYRAGGLGDVLLKRRLVDVLDVVLEPIRGERRRLADDLGHVDRVLALGTETARETAAATLGRVREVFGLTPHRSGPNRGTAS